jgi:AraC-like DNA-binding protein
MKFFSRALLVRIFLTAVASALTIYAGLDLAEKEIHLMPHAESEIVWTGSIQPRPVDGDAAEQGLTRTSIQSDGEIIQYEMFLSSKQSYPYGSYDFTFLTTQNQRRLVDLEPIESFRFSVKCSPRNVLIFVIFTFDDRVTVVDKDSTHRVNWHFFTCDGFWADKQVNLKDFETPDWWLQDRGLELADKSYDLRKSMGFAIVNSLQSPLDTTSQVSITGLVGIERRPIYVYIALVLAGAMGAAMIWWGFMLYAKRLVALARERMKEDMPLTAYQKLSMSTQVDKTKKSLLLFLAQEYADPEISLDVTMERLGINRNKINSILKEELGLTFTTYINKLRLTEAARLLCEHPEETISQIAYRVGFNNVSYFNKLFKETYGCSPKSFKADAPGTPPSDPMP